MNKLKISINKIFPKSRPVVFFHAHCDDESFLSAGLMNKLALESRKCIVIYGAAGIVVGQDKTLIRQKQTIESCFVLGVSSVLFMKFCESKYLKLGGSPLINQTVEDVSNNLLDLLLKNKIKLPISLVSYDKNGGYGNNDHKFINLVGRYISKKYSGSILLSEITINRDSISIWIKNATKRLDAKSLPQLSYWSTNFGLQNKDIQFTYKLTNKQLDLKYKALSFHKFYNTPDTFPLVLKRIDFKKVFGNEYIYIP